MFGRPLGEGAGGGALIVAVSGGLAGDDVDEPEPPLHAARTRHAAAPSAVPKIAFLVILRCVVILRCFMAVMLVTAAVRP